MRSGRRDRVIRFVLMCLLALLMTGGLTPLPVSAETRSAIVEKDMLVRLHADGSADVTERIVFGINGSVNNLLMEIRKPEHGGIGLEKVVSAGYRGDVVCRPLEAGQWDPTVFAGTYSLFDEPDRLLIKAYYTFGTYRSRFVIQYHLPQAAVRHPGVASLQLTPVSDSWPTRVERLHLQIVLPEPAPEGTLDTLLRGVFVGKVEVLGNQRIDVDIPDTVPGEAPVFTAWFPPELLPEAPVMETEATRADMMAKEVALRKAAVEPALRARERAAELAGKEALAEILRRQVRRGAGILSLVLTLAGVIALVWLQQRIRAPKALPPSEPKMDLLTAQPWMACMLLHSGRFDRGALRRMLQMEAESGLIEPAGTAVSRRAACAYRLAGDLPEQAEPVRRLFLEWFLQAMNEDRVVRLSFFQPVQGRDTVEASFAEARWEALRLEAERLFRKAGFITRIHERTRRSALAGGMLMFAAGLSMGVALAIWQPYLMLVPAVLLVMRGATGTGWNSRAVGLRQALRRRKTCRRSA